MTKTGPAKKTDSAFTSGRFEYGPRIGRMDEARRIMEALESFAAWAEEALR